MNEQSAMSSHRIGWAWGALGVVLLGACAGIARLSRDFTYGTPMADRPILALVGVLIAAGLVYLAAVALVPRSVPSRRLVGWVFVAGIAMRLILSAGQPILEDDFYRYLWDGAVTAHGHNPYAVIPERAKAGGESAGVTALATEAGIVLERVNHPALGTIYPPVTQAVFALAHWIGPWHSVGLRLVYFAVDVLALLLLLSLLRHAGRSELFSVVYWWNPLVAKESFNSLHMDILLVPCILAGVLLTLKGRPVLASVAVAIAAGVKLWPILLLPLVLATCWRAPRTMAAALAVFTGVAALLLLPMYPIAGAVADSGLVAYGARWEMNDALFMVFPWLLGQIAELGGLSFSTGALHRGGKIAVLFILTAMVLWTCRAIIRRPTAGNGDEKRWLAGRFTVLASALFLLSPTQFPWYYIWFLPLLPFVSGSALLALTVMLPLYYLRFYLAARGQIDFFHYRVVWLEFAPIWALLLWEWWTVKREE